MTITIATAVVAVILQQAPTAPAAPALPKALATQVMLDRAGFSPGPIDGHAGKNTTLALEAFQKSGGSEAQPADNPLTSYTITPEDAQGPFVPAIPEDMAEKSTLPALGYTSIVEMLAERFHSTPALIQRLNPGSQFEAGTTIRVPNVEPLVMPVESSVPSAPVARPEGGGGAKPTATGTAGRETVAYASLHDRTL